MNATVRSVLLLELAHGGPSEPTPLLCNTTGKNRETAETETGFWKETLKRQRRVAKVDPPSCNPEKERKREEFLSSQVCSTESTQTVSFVPQTFKAEFTSIKQHVLQQIDITCKPNFPVCCFEGCWDQAMVSNRETKIKQSEAGRWESNRLKADLTDSGFVWELLIHFNVHHGQRRH